MLCRERSRRRIVWKEDNKELLQGVYAMRAMQRQIPTVVGEVISASPQDLFADCYNYNLQKGTRMLSSNAMRGGTEMLIAMHSEATPAHHNSTACIVENDRGSHVPLLLGLELRENQFRFLKKDNRMHRENLALCCSKKGRSEAVWDINHSLTRGRQNG